MYNYNLCVIFYLFILFFFLSFLCYMIYDMISKWLTEEINKYKNKNTI